MGNMLGLRSRRAKVLLVTVGLMAGLIPTQGAQASHGSDEKLEIQAPHSGSVSSAPGTHHRPYGGDWSMDLAAGAGTPVRARWGRTTGGITARVAAVGPACATGNPADGGYQVRVDYSVDGVYVGWVTYAHVSPSVSVNQYLGNGAQIGVVGSWNWTSCWQGAHTHIESFNYRHYSCFNPVGGFIGDGTTLGVVGGQVGTVVNRSCTSADWNFITDTTPPSISATISPALNGHGWQRQNVTVTWQCADPSGISSCSGPTTISAETSGVVVTGTAVDAVGNRSTASVTIRIDKTNPALTASMAEAPNANGWFNRPVVINWDCSDGLSGLINGCTAQTVSTQGANQTRTLSASDRAGNLVTVTSPAFSVDLVAPTVSHSRDLQPNAHGWYSQPVTVQWLCSDDLSGLEEPCQESTVLGEEGANQEAALEVLDLAGNLTRSVDSGINIDMTAPTVMIDPSLLPSGVIRGTASDALSGLDSVVVEVTNVAARTTARRVATLVDGTWQVSTAGLPAGPSTVEAIASDKAGMQTRSAPSLVVLTV